MGDRAIIILKDSNKKFSPAIYLHWHAPQVQNYIDRLKEVMVGREDDLHYSTARLCGIIHNDIEGNLSFGVMALPGGFLHTKAGYEEYSHGDAGVFVVDINTWKIETYGGYGFEGGKINRDGGQRDRTIAAMRAAESER